VLREAETAHGHGDLDQALSLATRVVELARDLGSVDLEAQALQTAGRVVIDRGDVALGMAHLDEAMLFAVEGRLSPYATGKVYCSLVSACEDVGDHDRAAEWTEATMRWAKQHPFAIFPGICRVHRAVVLKRRGELAEAQREAERACAELSGSHQPNTAAAYAEVGDICRRLGRFDRAEEAFARSQELAGSPSGALALLRLAQGRTAQAVAIATGCMLGAANPLARAALLPIVVQVAVAAGELSTAHEAADELDGIAERFGTAVLAVTSLAARGRLHLAEGEPDLACSTLRDAVGRWGALGVPYEVATCRTLLGEALRECGDEDGALESFTAAAALFERIGAHLDAGLAAHDRSAPMPAGLTHREVEVLRLVAGGLTNNEIAGSLHLSAKTVSRHLSNIFAKLGVSSRAAATAFAFEHRLMERRTG
jgi:ATP/maltotriose-dependent transcriptional regulator MalT